MLTMLCVAVMLMMGTAAFFVAAYAEKKLSSNYGDWIATGIILIIGFVAAVSGVMAGLLMMEGSGILKTAVIAVVIGTMGELLVLGGVLAAHRREMFKNLRI